MNADRHETCKAVHFERFTQEHVRCALRSDHPGGWHDDGAVVWYEDLDPHPVNRIACAIESAAYEIGAVLNLLSLVVPKAADRLGDTLRRMRGEVPRCDQ